ncbi:MAG: sulfur carrier protein ThiS [Candidatus Eremiobacteraeota bacterium]|nr:sulfur carrier protein ThiS [Candidatus Eremiobacteraeota bacterium]
MTIVANGKLQQVVEGMTVNDFLESLRLSPEQVVVEYNNEALLRSHFGSTHLEQDDKLEIAQMVGGG